MKPIDWIFYGFCLFLLILHALMDYVEYISRKWFLRRDGDK
jgi:hypothetical protein